MFVVDVRWPPHILVANQRIADPVAGDDDKGRTALYESSLRALAKQSTAS
jgi:hypothetical protein